MIIAAILLSTLAAHPEPQKAAEPVSVEKGMELHKKTGKPLVIQYGTDWCPPCRQQKAKLKEMLKDRDDFIWAYVDVDKTPTPGVSGIPHMRILLDGKVVHDKAGYLSPAQLLRKMKLEAPIGIVD